MFVVRTLFVCGCELHIGPAQHPETREILPAAKVQKCTAHSPNPVDPDDTPWTPEGLVVKEVHVDQIEVKQQPTIVRPDARQLVRDFERQLVKP